MAYGVNQSKGKTIQFKKKTGVYLLVVGRDIYLYKKRKEREKKK